MKADLEKLVHQALSNACDNGYRDDMMEAPLQVIALDLSYRDYGIEDYLDTHELVFMDLVPHIESWRKVNVDA